MKINLGCKNDVRKGCLNVDIDPVDSTVFKFDLNQKDWWEKLPIPSEGCEEVLFLAIYEHIDKLSKREILTELANITKTGGIVYIKVPCMLHHTSLASLQHTHVFYFNSFEEGYTQPYFKVLSIHARWRTRFGVIEIPYKAPLRTILRFLARLTLVPGIVFILQKK